MGSAAACHKPVTPARGTHDSLDALPLFQRIGPEVSLSLDRSWKLERDPKYGGTPPWIYQRVKAYDAQEWAARFGLDPSVKLPGEPRTDLEGALGSSDH
eukprot:Skav224761  [mRNA]  locus=scaffold1604:230569:231720:+ [translate_table: standard]